MPTINISAENYRRIQALALNPFINETARMLPDGRYEIPVSEDTLERLRAISPDDDAALNELFGSRPV